MVVLALLVALLAIAVHAGLAVRSTVTLSAQRSRALARQAAWLAGQAASVAPAAPEEAIRHDRSLHALFESAMAGDPTIYDLGIFDPSGRALIHSQSARVGKAIPRRPTIAALEEGNVLRQGMRLLGPPRAYEDRVPLADDGRRFGEVRVGVSTALLRVELLDSLRAGVWVTVGALLLAILVALAFAQFLSQRVRIMMTGLERLREGEFGHRLAVEGRDELALLASSINALGERLETTRRRAAAGQTDPSELLVATGQISAWARVVSGLAHELADPLNAAALHLGHFKRKWRSPSQEAGRHLKVLEDELRRIEEIVLGFRRFSMLGEMRPRWFDLQALLEEEVERGREAASPRIELKLDGDQAPRRFWGDPQLLGQACSNLISNAVQAMPGGGPVSVDVECQEEGVAIMVSDQGVGIPEELQEQVFDVYFTTKQGGSGIGLAVVQQVVKLHGGRVRLRSNPGEGTQLVLELPIRVAEPAGVA